MVRVVDSPLFTASVGVVIVALFSYAVGRLHQWYKTTSDRELAFREGYDTAVQSLFSFAVRVSKSVIRRPVAPGAGVVSLAEAKQEQEKRKPEPRSTARHRATAGRRSVSESSTRIIIPPKDRLSA